MLQIERMNNPKNGENSLKELNNQLYQQLSENTKGYSSSAKHAWREIFPVVTANMKTCFEILAKEETEALMNPPNGAEQEGGAGDAEKEGGGEHECRAESGGGGEQDEGGGEHEEGGGEHEGIAESGGGGEQEEGGAEMKKKKKKKKRAKQGHDPRDIVSGKRRRIAKVILDF